jgi:hypothetical protein
MSLGRLLTSGKTLIGLHGAGGRYEMRRKNLLPKFGTASNPFTGGHATAAPSGAEEKFQAVRRTLSPEETHAAELKETRRLPEVGAIRAMELLEESRARETAGQGVRVTEAARPGLARRTAGAGARIAVSIANALRVLNPMFWWRKWSDRVGRAGRAPVQGELSLDNIKVIRNDLSDADVEAVRVRVAVTPVVEEAPAVKPEDETPELIKV